MPDIAAMEMALAEWTAGGVRERAIAKSAPMDESERIRRFQAANDAMAGWIGRPVFGVPESRGQIEMAMHELFTHRRIFDFGTAGP